MDVKVLGEFYFSQLQGMPIYSEQGKLIGRVRDMAICWDYLAPRIVGIKYTRGQQLIPTECIAHWDEKQIRLSAEYTEGKTVPLQENETYIGKWLLDKQIIDLKGSKLVRVNDITLSWVFHEGRNHIFLVAVDIGLRGLFRRIGLEFLVKNRPNNFLGWQYINPLENRTSNLQLNREKQQLGKLHPADIAYLIEEMDYHSRANFIETLDSQQAVDALAEMELETQVEIFEQMDNEKASDLLEELPPDEAADILGELPEEKSREILELMEDEDAQEVQELMDYPEDTAGALMTTEFIAFSGDMTAQEAINQLRSLAPEAETIYYLYVMDEKEILQGVLSLRELILADPSARLREFMHHKIIAVLPDDDHRKVADTINKYGLLAVPVVDESGMILGIITVDDVLDILMSDRGKTEVFSRLLGGKRSGRGWKQ